MDLPRRTVLQGVALAAAAGSLSQAAQNPQHDPAPSAGPRPFEIIDTNVNLFEWPFRRLPHDTVPELLAKLKEHSIKQAWAGSFEGLLHRDVAGVNARLAESCQAGGQGRLTPIGTVNLSLPDWEEDLRRCHEVHRMPGIRLHPNYHGYTLADEQIPQFLALATRRHLLVQIATSMEDPRTQHPLVQVPDVNLSPLAELLPRFPGARVLLLNHKLRGAPLFQLAKTPGVYFDLARVEATDGAARLIETVSPERVVFGTHAPFFIYESALIKLYESNLGADVCRAICEQNPTQLLAASLTT